MHQGQIHIPFWEKNVTLRYLFHIFESVITIKLAFYANGIEIDKLVLLTTPKR